MLKKLNNLLRIITLVFGTLLVFSCGGTSGGSGFEDASLSISLPSSRATWNKGDAATFDVTIVSSSYDETKTANAGETITFSAIPVGHYTVTVIGKNSSGTVISRGSSEADVVADQSSSVSITMAPLNYYTVTFNMNGASGSVNDQNVTEGYTVTRPTDPTATGKTFSFWSASAASPTEYDFTAPVTSDITLYAIWDVVTYNNTFDYNGGTDGSGNTSYVQQSAYGTTPTEPTPTRTGYTLNGWSGTLGGSNVTIVPVTADTTYYARWEPIKYYARFYNGSTVHSTNQLYYDDVPTNITVTKPTKTGYVFKGWTSTQPVEGTPSTIDLPYVEGTDTIVISTNLKDTQGSYKDYWAIWEGNPFTAYFFEITNMNTTTVSSSTGYDSITYTVVSMTPATYSLKVSSTAGEYYLNKGSSWSTVTGTVSYYETSGEYRFIFTITESGTQKHYICSKTPTLSTADYKAKAWSYTPTAYYN